MSEREMDLKPEVDFSSAEEVRKDLLQDGRDEPPMDSLEGDLEAMKAEDIEDYQPNGSVAPIATPALDFIYTVLYSKILVRRLSTAEIQAQYIGIAIPQTAEEAPCEAEVLVVGEGRLMPSGVVVPLRVRVGDRVLFKEHCGHDILIEGQLLTVLQEDEISVIARRG